MTCTACGFLMSSFDAECPRCQGKGIEQPTQPTPKLVSVPPAAEPKADSTASLVVYFLVALILPPAGFLFGLVYSITKTQRALSCFAGALLGMAIGFWLINSG